MTSFLQKLGFGLKKSSAKLTGGISSIFTKRRVDAQTLDELEELLISSDIGVRASAKIIGSFAKRRLNKDAGDTEIKNELAADIKAILQPCEQPLAIDDTQKPFVILMVGVNGAGKTTLIRLLLALADPQEGSITLSPANITQSSLSTLEVSPQTRSNFVYVPQGNTLFSGTIRDNLLMGNPHATEAEMLQALRTACADFVLSLPDGIDANLNEQGGGLSEGQAQRIAIARTLLRPGHILLLDEATSALDPETERQLIKNLRRDCTGKTFIFITHHPAVAEACEATIQL